MSHPRQIERPTLPDAKPLTAAELNSLKFTDRHTLLTPEYLEKMQSLNADRKSAPDTQSQTADTKISSKIS